MNRKLDDDQPHISLYAVAFLRGDAKGMAEQTAWFEGRPELEHEILTLESDTEGYSGHLRTARELTERAVQSALRADNREAAAAWQLSAAWREALFGNLEEARRKAETMPPWLRWFYPAPGTRRGLRTSHRISPSAFRCTRWCSLIGYR
jgi:hypothetical protein